MPGQRQVEDRVGVRALGERARVDRDLAEVVLVRACRRTAWSSASPVRVVAVRRAAQHVVVDRPADAVGRLGRVLGAGREGRAPGTSPSRSGSVSDAVRTVSDDRRRRRDRVRPVGAGDRDPQRVAGRRLRRRRRRARPRRRTSCPGTSGDGGAVDAVAVGEVERAAGDQRRGAVGEDVAQLHRERRGRASVAQTRSAEHAGGRRPGPAAARPPRSASARRRAAGRRTAPTAGGRRSRSRRRCRRRATTASVARSRRGRRVASVDRRHGRQA